MRMLSILKDLYGCCPHLCAWGCGCSLMLTVLVCKVVLKNDGYIAYNEIRDMPIQLKNHVETNIPLQRKKNYVLRILSARGRIDHTNSKVKWARTISTVTVKSRGPLCRDYSSNLNYAANLKIFFPPSHWIMVLFCRLEAKGTRLKMWPKNKKKLLL